MRFRHMRGLVVLIRMVAASAAFCLHLCALAAAAAAVVMAASVRRQHLSYLLNALTPLVMHVHE